MLPGYFEVNIALCCCSDAFTAPARGVAVFRTGGVYPDCFFSVRGAQEYSRDVRVMERDFYGVVRNAIVMIRTVSLNASRRYRARRPIAGRRIPQSAERLLRAVVRLRPLVRRLNEQHPQPRRVGSSVSVPACSLRTAHHDEFTFYEISPRVVDIASDEFTFLRYSAAKIQVVLGDGRLSLERAMRRPTIFWYRCVCGRFDPDASGHARSMALYVAPPAPNGVSSFRRPIAISI